MLRERKIAASRGRESSSATAERTSARKIALQLRYLYSNSKGYLTRIKAASAVTPKPGRSIPTINRSASTNETTSETPESTIQRPPPTSNPSEPSPNRNNTLGGGYVNPNGYVCVASTSRLCRRL